MDTAKAKDYLDRILTHRLDVLATTEKKKGVGKLAAAKIVEADAVRFLVGNTGTIGIKPGTPVYDELIEFVVDLAVNVVDAEYSY